MSLTPLTFHLRSLRYLLFSVGFLGCKVVAPGAGQTDTQDERGDYVTPKSSAVVQSNAADADYLSKNGVFFFRVWNREFTRRLDDLPMAGEVASERMPWSGGYYPENDGGTDVVVVGTKSPLAKYDDAFHGGQSKAASWEREKHTGGPSWAGHCNGFSAAATRHPKEPARSVSQNGVVFSPQDVKALLAEVYMSADYEFLGGNRCDRQGTPSADRVLNPGGSADPTVMGACEDINPGTLHAAIANWIGRIKYPLIMDVATGEEVWNYPLFKYQVLRKDYITENQARQYVAGSGGGDYVWNPLATKFALMQIRLTYAEALRRETLGQLYTKDLELTYVLELSKDGDILGGEWVGAPSRNSHPDFLWVALEPSTPNGTRFVGNPHVDAKEVFRLWALSAGFDANNPPQTISRPAATDSWGDWPSFSARIDGNDRGAAFKGKKAILRIQRKGPLLGSGVSLDIGLNGQSIASLLTKGDEELALSLDPGLGQSRLEFTWKRGGNLVDSQSLRFVAVP
jgi:hypothetical protein